MQSEYCYGHCLLLGYAEEWDITRGPCQTLWCLCACMHAVQVIALKHTNISAMFREVQTCQAAANSRLSQLSQQLQGLRAARGSKAASRATLTATTSSTAISSEGSIHSGPVQQG